MVLPNWVGDLVLATSALRALRQHYAGRHITFVVKRHLMPVLSGGDWMDQVLCWPGRDPSRPKRRQSFLGFAAELRDQQFDLAVLFTNSFRSALLARLAGIKRRVGYDRDGRGLLLTDKLLPQKADGKYIPVPMIRYYNAIARYLGCRECPELPELFTTPEDEQAAATALASAGVGPGQPYMVINPGASFGPAKCWLPERFAEVADRLAERQKLAVLISCGPREIEVARAVASRMRKPVTVLSNPVMPLGPSKALIRRASLLLTNDTGPRHFANSFGTPVVTVFGPTDPQWTTTAAANERSLMVKVDCGPCMKRKCPLDHRCMTRISADMALTQATELLESRAPAAAAK
jgi:heptosyltransferase-2